MKIYAHVYRMNLIANFRVAREAYHYQDCLIVELALDGVSGYGEASAFMPTTYHSSIDEMLLMICEIRKMLNHAGMEHPKILWKKLHSCLKNHPFLACAIDEAAYDLWGKLNKETVSNLLSVDRSNVPLSSFSIGIDSVENTIQMLRSHIAWPEFKIKLGSAQDLELLSRLRNIVSKPFRVDVNCGWSLEKSIFMLEKLEQLNVKYIEEPLKARSWSDYAVLKKLSVLPIVADESCVTQSDILKCAKCFQGVNIKLMKAGGITPALEMIRIAKNLNLKVMLGCMPESSVGVSAIAQIAPLVDSIDLDSLSYLESDIATGVKVINGKIIYSEEPGFGVSLL